MISLFFCQDWARKQIVKDIRKRLDSAGARRAAHMQQIVAKANDENIKVDEVIFINRYIGSVLIVSYLDRYLKTGLGLTTVAMRLLFLSCSQLK